MEGLVVDMNRPTVTMPERVVVYWLIFTISVGLWAVLATIYAVGGNAQTDECEAYIEFLEELE